MSYLSELKEARRAYDCKQWKDAASKFFAILESCSGAPPLEAKRKHAVSQLNASLEQCSSFSLSSDINWLTIAIPTYNRRVRLLRTLDNIDERFGIDRIPIVISDNGSTDGTYEAVQSKYSGRRNLRIVRSDINHNFAWNYCCVLMLSTTAYTLLLSDEDQVIPTNIHKLYAFLSDKHPDFVSPLVIRDDKRYRGRYETCRITPSAFWESSFYISGLIYRTLSVQKIISARHGHLTSQESFYPQCLVAATLLLSLKGYWTDLPLIEYQPQEHSFIHAETGNNATYNGVIGRWISFLHTEEYLRCQLDAAPHHVTIQSQIQTHYTTVYSVMRAALRRDAPHVLGHFDSAARSTALSAILKDSGHPLG
jgi:hypothetical protein